MLQILEYLDVKLSKDYSTFHTCSKVSDGFNFKTNILVTFGQSLGDLFSVPGSNCLQGLS